VLLYVVCVVPCCLCVVYVVCITVHCLYNTILRVIGFSYSPSINRKSKAMIRSIASRAHWVCCDVHTGCVVMYTLGVCVYDDVELCVCVGRKSYLTPYGEYV